MKRRAARTLTFLSLLSIGITAPAVQTAKSLAGDQYCPAEETAERNAIEWPRTVAFKTGATVLQSPGKPAQEVRPGDRFGDFDLVAILPGSEPMAVLERNFARWGIIAYIGKNGPVATLRKSVGRLEILQPPRAPFPASYYDELLAAQEDLLGERVLAGNAEPSYEAVANLLPPLDSYTFLGTVTSRQKVIVQPDGRLGFGRSKQHGGLEQILFDPWRESAVFGAAVPDASKLPNKKGLVGGYLPVIDYAFYDVSRRAGFEEIAFATGDDPKVHVRMRASDGKRTYWTLPGTGPTADGTAFYRDLFRVHATWKAFFDRAMKLKVPEVRVSDASKAGIVRGLITYIGPYPKYGVLTYAEERCDSFPPTTILFNSVLMDWGLHAEARQRLGFYLNKFVKADGTFDYYGPAVSEYGQVLAFAARYARVARDPEWLVAQLAPLERIGDRLLKERTSSRRFQTPDSSTYGLIYGAAEADTRKEQAFYFSGNVWAWRGLVELGQWMNEQGAVRGDPALAGRGKEWLAQADAFREDILTALKRARRADTKPPFVPPIAGTSRVFNRMTEDELSSYTNYRYWLEMLSAEMLPAEMRDEIIAYRAARGGDLLRTTRFRDGMDDWPYANYARSLLDSGQVKDYLLGFYGHLAHHTTPGTLTSYEMVAIKGGATRSHRSDYCVPVQVVTAQLLRWMLVWEPWGGDTLYLAPAVPHRWYRQGFAAREVTTRWGLVSLTVKPSGTGLSALVEMPSAPAGMKLNLRLPPSTQVKVTGAKAWKWDEGRHLLTISGVSKRLAVTTR